MNKRIYILLLSLFVGCLYSVADAQINYSITERLTKDWKFLKSDLGSIWEAVRPYSPGNPEAVPLWEDIELPHCVNATDAVDPDVNYYQGPSWYKKCLTLNNPFKEGRTILHFEGAGQKCEVYVFTELVASHIGGYDEWSVDITDAVARFLKTKDAERFKGQIPLSIRCDNTRDTELIPSDLSDFNLYGGIYRYLNLVYTPSLSIKQVKISPQVNDELNRGTVNLDLSFLDYRKEKSYTDSVLIEIFDPSGKRILSDEKVIELSESGLSSDYQISKPQLWSTIHPNLYSCELTLLSSSGNIKVKDNFGFRKTYFEKQGPFYLNNERLLLRGTHRHEDHAGLGAAMTEDLIRKEMLLMKDMGVNFIRLGHYQQSRIVLDLCDSLGILVWEEIPWCRGGLGGEAYQNQAKNMLKQMITQHYNHPSVLLWGLGNENDWPNDFPEFDKQKIRTFMSELHELAHKLDNSRGTAIRRCHFCKDIVDVYSPSIWAGWYRGIYTDYKSASLTEMKKVDHFLHVEWGGDSHARRYAESTYESLSDIKESNEAADERAGDASFYGGIARASKDGDWSESYIVDLIDWHLKEQETMEWLTGAAYWPFKDFSTPVRPLNPVPYMNQKGVVERDLTPKEGYYVFQSYWVEQPMIHIYGQNWDIRWGKEGENKIIKIYSNCDEVELFVNGQSLGTKQRNSQDFPAAGLRWEYPFKAGNYHLKALGVKKGETVKTEQKLAYESRPFGDATQMLVKLTENGEQSCWVEVQLIDENGVPALLSQDWVRFNVIGDGHLEVNQGTSSGSSKVQAFNGKARVKLNKQDGVSAVSIAVKGIGTELIKIK